MHRVKAAILLTILSLLVVPTALSDTSPTTGLAYPPGRNNEYRPILVSIENDVNMQLTVGLSLADVVYEYLYLGRHSTRYLSVFNDNYPSTVGPFASARHFGADLRQEWDAPFVYYGGVLTSEGKAVIDIPAYMDEMGVPESLRFDGMQGDQGIFRRDVAMNPPRNGVVDLQTLVNQSWPVDPETEVPHEATVPAWTHDRNYPVNKEEPITLISIQYEIFGYSPGFYYNADKQVYERVQNGEPLADPLTQQVISAKNVIVQYMELAYQDGMPSDPRITSTGKGKVDAFINGNHITGYWIREDINEKTRYFDEDDNEMRFAPGQTFIQIVPADGKITYE